MLPTDWQTDDAGAYEGALTLHGPFEGRSYRISLRYPIFEQVPRSLAAWVDQEIRAIYADDVRPLIAETAVAGAPAAIVHGWEGVDAPADEVFIWYGQGHNPRRISVVFTDVGPSDRSVTERLLSRFLAGIAP
jgi:hypothetical protein